MATYTHGHGDEVLRAYRWRSAENSAGYLLPALRPGLDLLDVGCGPGSITVDLAARVAPGRVGRRHPGGPPVVGAVVGRPAHGVDVHRAGARARVRDPGRARGDRRGLPALGGRRRRLAGHAARRAAHPRVNGCVDARFPAW